jgi:hypothetical protein
MAMTVVVAMMLTITSGHFHALATLPPVKDPLVSIELKSEWV